jgi:hypothetical protein
MAPEVNEDVKFRLNEPEKNKKKVDIVIFSRRLSRLKFPARIAFYRELN